MITIPNDAQKIAVEDATVDFVIFKNEGTTFYAFDTSGCEPPEPMVNAMAGLRLIDGPDKRLIMVNHKMPMGLFNKIGEDFDIQSRTSRRWFGRSDFFIQRFCRLERSALQCSMPRIDHGPDIE